MQGSDFLGVTRTLVISGAIFFKILVYVFVFGRGRRLGEVVSKIALMKSFFFLIDYKCFLTTLGL